MHTYHYGDSALIVFIFGAVFNVLANNAPDTFMDYGLKAIIGGIVWLVFKVLSDFIASKFKTKKD